MLYLRRYIFLMLFLCIHVAGCGKGVVEPVVVPPPQVTAFKPESRQVSEFFEYIGRTASPEFVEIRPRVSGYLMNVHFKEGSEVKAEEPLFEIDRRPYEYALKNAGARLEQAKQQLKLATITFDRINTLRKTNSVSQQELDEAVQKQDSATAEITAGEAAVAQADLDLKFCEIKAPIAGRIGRASVTEGNLIQAGQANAEPLTTIASVDKIHVLFDVDENSVLKFMALRRSQGVNVKYTNVRELNQKVQVALANETDFPHEGILDFIDNRVRTTTGTLLVRAELDNKARIFAPGFFVRVRIPYGEAQKVLMISERAILNDQSLKYVLTVGKNGIVERRDVELGILDNGMRVIKAGLTADDQVIVNGVQRAKPGAKVRILEPQDRSTSSPSKE
jgi:multidrug efflux system membrane fusion protein